MNTSLSIFARALASENISFSFDNKAQTASFEVDDYVRWRLMEGLDDIGITLTHAGDIDSYETTRPSWLR